MDCGRNEISFSAQNQNRQPELEYIMNSKPKSECGKTECELENKVALITGGDSGIDRAVVYDFVKESAAVAIVYYDEVIDTKETVKRIAQFGGTIVGA